MGGIFNAIVGFVGSVIDVVVKAISTIVGAIWDVAFKYIIEPVMAFLGFTDEDIYNISIVSSKVYDKDQLAITRTKLISDKMKNNTGAKEYVLGYSKVGDMQFSKYYYKGKYDYVDYLPDAQFHATAIPTKVLEETIEKKLGKDISIVDAVGMTPYDEDWCKYQMQEQYNYDIGKDYLIYDNIYYKYDKLIYNSSSNNFKVYFSSFTNLRKVTYKTTKITITSKNDTTDIKNTIVQLEHNFYRIDTNSYLFTNINIESNTTEDIPKNTESSSTNSVLESEEIVTNPEYTKIYTISNHNNNRCFVVKYLLKETSRLYYWIYDPTTNIYPNLSSPVLQVVDFEMYPVIMLRNNYFNVADYDKTIINDTPRPPSITKERYEDTVNILNTIGVDLEELTKAYSDNESINKLQDAFFLLGVSPSDTDPIVSKALFEVFDFVYDTLPYSGNSKAYAASFKENPYNAAISWLPRPIEIKEEKICEVGECKHYIRDNILYTTEKLVTKVSCLGTNVFGACTKIKIETHKEKIIKDKFNIVLFKEVTDYKSHILYNNDDSFKDYTIGTTEEIIEETADNTKDLIITKQINKTQTKIISLYSFTSFTIIRHGGGNGGVTLPLDSKDLVIPLAVDVIKRLSIMDRTKLLDNVVYMQFYAVEHIHLEWYQTSKFMSFLKILSIGITVVVSIVSFGTMTAEAVTLTSVLWAVLETITIGAGLQLALHLISTFVDNPTLKIILSVAATATAIAIGGGFNEFNFIDAVKLADSAVDAINLTIVDKFDNLIDKMKDFNEVYKEKLDVFKNIQDELNSGLTVQDIVDISITSSNTRLIHPSAFFYTALEAYKDFDSLYAMPDNLGNFVDNSLQLQLEI